MSLNMPWQELLWAAVEESSLSLHLQTDLVTEAGAEGWRTQRRATEDGDRWVVGMDTRQS